MTPAEKLKRRQRTRDVGRELVAELRQRLPDLPLETELVDEGPVDDEDGSLIVKTDGAAILRVLAVANDLARQMAERADSIRIVPRVWPRTIWCRRSTRPTPTAPKPGEQPRLGGRLYSTRDTKGNILLCVPTSHAGEHDFGD